MWFAEARAHQAALLPGQAVLLAPGASALALPAAPAEPAVPGWRPALDALLQGLRARDQRRGSIALTLGAAFVRWQLMDWPAGVGSPQELDAAVRLRLRSVHGAAVADWQVLRAEGAPGQPVPACAIDSALLRAARDELAAAGWRLRSLQPYAAAALDHWRHAWRRGNAWVAVIEPGHLTLALFEQGQWRALRSQRLQGEGPQAWQAPLPALQQQMGLALQPAPQALPLYLIGAADAADGAAAQPGWQALQPQGPAGQRDGLARLARGC